MTYIDKLAWIHIVDKKVLITRSKGKDTYYIPGGKREENETDEQALCREIKEELSVDLNRESIEYVGTFKAQAHGKAEGVIVQMTCYAVSYVGELAVSSEIEEMAWFEYKDKEKSSAVDQIIFDWLKEQGLIN
ncbi:MAG: NUDIX domain-containing protein [Alphaproteobacteria bacterium]|nr:NUDIX domain-containing protein [Alphaproteobacteria bacterium]MDD9919478.1 NUDIX domain-containing protein [Alphaproteobacteria bacterium]